jgi:hypothetical protein
VIAFYLYKKKGPPFYIAYPFLSWIGLIIIHRTIYVPQCMANLEQSNMRGASQIHTELCCLSRSWRCQYDAMESRQLPQGVHPNISHSLCVQCQFCMHGLFSILEWWKRYSLDSFWSGLMARLTLTSLGIRQVAVF